MGLTFLTKRAKPVSKFTVSRYFCKFLEPRELFNYETFSSESTKASCELEIGRTRSDSSMLDCRSWLSRCSYIDNRLVVA